MFPSGAPFVTCRTNSPAHLGRLRAGRGQYNLPSPRPFRATLRMNTY
jgi:hypothetical protein